VQIQINTDRNIASDDQIHGQVEELVSGSLGRFGERVTRVEVHLSDVNGQKGGRDIRCVMEARLAGFPPVAVDDQAETIQAAVHGAVGKLERVLDTRVERTRGH
jgi:ribosome-associated translation inhibitor RaiA